MKKYIIPIMVVLIMLVGCQSQNKEINKTKEIYNIMAEAQKEKRNLTDKEKTIVEDWENSTISLQKNDLNHAVHAMYFNFYETLTTDDPINFNAAKNKAKQLLN